MKVGYIPFSTVYKWFKATATFSSRRDHCTAEFSELGSFF